MAPVCLCKRPATGAVWRRWCLPARLRLTLRPQSRSNYDGILSGVTMGAGHFRRSYGSETDTDEVRKRLPSDDVGPRLCASRTLARFSSRFKDLDTSHH